MVPEMCLWLIYIPTLPITANGNSLVTWSPAFLHSLPHGAVSALEMFCGRQGPLFIPALQFLGRREEDLLAEQAPQLSRQHSPPAWTNGAGEWEGQNVSLQEGEWEAVKKSWSEEEMRRMSVIRKTCFVACSDESRIKRVGLGRWGGKMRTGHVANGAAQHGCRQGASCLLLFCAKCGACLFLTLSLANPAVENHSMMSIQQELLPDEASLANGSRTPMLTVRNPLWERQTPLLTTALSSHGWPRWLSCNLPYTFYRHGEVVWEVQWEERHKLWSARSLPQRSCSCVFLLLLPCGLFFLEYVKKTEFQHPACEGDTCVRAPRH